MTYYQTCMGICLGVIIFSLCVNFVNILDVFPMSYSDELPQMNSSSTTVKGLTNVNNEQVDMDNLFAVAGGLFSVGAIVILLLTKNAAILGAYLFSGIFWIAYGRAIGILLSSGLLNIGAMATFTGIFTIIIGLLFLGAVVGMLTGNG